MNDIRYEQIRFPDKSFPWFDEWSKSMTYCKVYHDGSSYVAIPSSTVKSKKSERFIPIRQRKDELFEQLYFEAFSIEERSDLFLDLTSAERN